MKILLLDIETLPMKVLVFGLYQEVTSMSHVKQDWTMACWCAKWLDSKEVMSDALPNYGDYNKNKPNDTKIVSKLHKLLDEADVVVTQNGVRFDVSKIYAKFIEHGIKPPSPFKNVDTCKIAKSIFGFTSNKLDDIGKLLKVGRKINTGGFKLWNDCMEGDLKAWNKMVRYCANDVLLLEKVYKKMLPFMNKHPNRNCFSEVKNNCPKCGSDKIIQRGYIYQTLGKRKRFQCKSCGGWCSGDKIMKNI